MNTTTPVANELLSALLQNDLILEEGLESLELSDFKGLEEPIDKGVIEIFSKKCGSLKSLYFGKMDSLNENVQESFAKLVVAILEADPQNLESLSLSELLSSAEHAAMVMREFPNLSTRLETLSICGNPSWWKD